MTCIFFFLQQPSSILLHAYLCKIPPANLGKRLKHEPGFHCNLDNLKTGHSGLSECAKTIQAFCNWTSVNKVCHITGGLLILLDKQLLGGTWYCSVLDLCPQKNVKTFESGQHSYYIWMPCILGQSHDMLGLQGMILFQTKKGCSNLQTAALWLKKPVSALSQDPEKKNLPPLFLPPVSCNAQYSTLFHNTSKLRRQFRCLRKSTQPHFWNKSERMHSIATGNATHMVFAVADDYIFTTLHRPLRCNECNKNGQRRVQEHVMWLPLPAIPPGCMQINSKLFMVYFRQSWKEGKNVYNVYRVKQTGSRQMTQPERPFEKCSY